MLPTMNFVMPPEISSTSLTKTMEIYTQAREKQISFRSRSSGHVEIEFRLGVLENSRFVPGVSQLAFQDLLDKLDAYTEWDSVSPWRRISDFFFYDDDGQQIRSSREMGDDIKISHSHKTHVKQHVVAIQNCERVCTALRVSLCLEVPVQGGMPAVVQPEQVRVKHRKSYRKGLWLFDMSRVWTGVNIGTMDMSGDAALFEVEIERMPGPINGDITFQALDALLKIVGLLPSGVKIE